MAFLITWTPTAEDWLDNQVNYLEENGFTKILKGLIKGIDKSLKVMANFPESGTPTSKKGIRRLNIDKNTIVFYKVEIQNVIVLTFFDTRQNPTEKPF